MDNLSQENINKLAEAIAPRLVDSVRANHHDFWIDPEEHYNAHRRWESMDEEELYEVKNLVKMFRATKGLAFKAFIGFAIIGAIVLAAIGLGVKYG